MHDDGVLATIKDKGMKRGANIRKSWWQEHWKEILVTLAPAMIALATSVVQFAAGRQQGSSLLFTAADWAKLNGLLQTVFIIATLFILLRCWNKVRDDVNQEGQIKRYLLVYCDLRDEGDAALSIAYSVVKGSVSQFFWA